MGGNVETKCQAEKEGMTLQGLHSNRNLSHIQLPNPDTIVHDNSASWQEPDIAVSWEAWPVPYKYRGGFSQPTIELSKGSPIEELAKGSKEL